MVVLMLRFPGRRYHATPWGHHVNEGLVEWPPSPWRVLRALLSVGYSTLGWEASVHEPWRSQPPPAARTLIDKLASVLPRYHLPLAAGTHSRHYMPKLGFDSQKDKTLVFDTWAQIDQGELGIQWDVALTADERTVLVELAARLSYLGRSESWVVARLARDEDAARLVFDVSPCEGAPAPGLDWQQIAVMAPMAPTDFQAWRSHQIERVLLPFPLPAIIERMPVALKRKRTAAVEPFPESMLACLQTDTAWQRSFGWSQPPGSRKVLYWRRGDAMATPVQNARLETQGKAAPVPFVLLSLATPSGNLHALPPLARGLPQGEMLHRQMVAARLRLAPGEAPSRLSGCDTLRRPLAGAHGHAHVLSLDLDDDGHIDHLLVWAPEGLDSTDQRALRATRGTYTKGGVGELRLAWAGAGSASDLACLVEPFGRALRRTIGRSTVWISATPFVPPRHVKSNGRNALTGQIQAELASRGLPAATTVELLDPQNHDLAPQDRDLARRLRHHVRRRRNGPLPPIDHGVTLRLQFATPVMGPLCLGYGSHFSLGRFDAEGCD
jgi:CRISPR-associated protein Csb2